MKVKNLFENAEGKKLGELEIRWKIVAPGGVRREKWEGDLVARVILTSLEGAPKIVSGDFNCSSNKRLTSLEGGPTEVGQTFFCSGNEQLTSLEGGPTKVGKYFYCSNNNQLTSLEGAPTEVGEDFCCDHNKQLTSLEGVPTKIKSYFSCVNNNLITSLENIHKLIHEIDGDANFNNTPIKSHVLGLLKIKNLKKVELNNKEVEAIINKYLPEGDLLDCQEELIDAGLEEYAQL